MYITPINQQIINYNPPAKTSRQSYCAKNKESSDTINFKGLKHRTNTIAPIIGCIVGTALLLMCGVAKCGNFSKKSNPYADRDSVYYDSKYENRIDSILIGLNDTLTQAQEEQRDRMIEEKYKAFEDIPYGTPERDYAEKIAYEQVDSVTLPESESGHIITPNEEAQILLNSEDSINAKYPDMKIRVRL